LPLALCRTDEEHQGWDEFLQTCPGASYWQLHGWLSSYRPMGLQCDVLVHREAGNITAGAAFLAFNLPMKMGRVIILPHGPVVDPRSSLTAHDVLHALNHHFERLNAVYVQTWPHVAQSDIEGFNAYREAGYTGERLFHSHEFSSVLLEVDITRSQEQVLADARRNTRYYGRASQHTGLELRLGQSQQDLEACFQVWSENGEYHGFAPRPLSSYRIVMDRLISRGQGLLLQAFDGNQMAGAIMVLFVGRGAVYAAGAIRRKHASLLPAEFLHLAAMQQARERGLRTYDFNNWGSPGTAQFKRGFRPVETKWALPRTLVLRPRMARLVCWGERHAKPLLRGLARLKAKRARPVPSGGT